jgi:hypothetical protein
VVVDLSSATTQVDQIDVNNGIYTITPSTLSALPVNLISTVPVMVYGVPEASGHILAYVLYFTTTGAL